MSEKERLKDEPGRKERTEPTERQEPYQGRGVLARYFEGTLDPEGVAALRARLRREDLEDLLDLADPGPAEFHAVEFPLNALPARRKGAALVQGPYRLALDRVSRNELSLSLREGDRPLGQALAVLEPGGSPGAPELARAVTNERGEARFRLRGVTPAPKGDYRVRVLVDPGPRDG